MNNIVKAIKASKTFLICMHVDPDGDTIGSANALSLLLARMGKISDIYSVAPIPSIYGFLKRKSKLVAKPNKKYDCIIALDCGGTNRIPGGEMIMQYSDLIINIDHHSDNSMFGDINYVEDCSSTGELIFDLAKKLNIKIDKDIAECIYTAMITDTGSFRYNNTSAKVFDIAAQLLRLGVSPYKVASSIYESRTASEIKILGRALEKIRSTKDGKIAWVALSSREIKASKATSEELRQIVDYVRSLKDAEIAIFLRETAKDKVKVNFRSKSRNIRKLANMFNGGGHKRASGAVIEGSLSDTTRKVVSAAKKIWTEL